MIHGKSFTKNGIDKEATYNIYILLKKYIYTGVSGLKQTPLNLQYGSSDLQN